MRGEEKEEAKRSLPMCEESGVRGMVWMYVEGNRCDRAELRVAFADG